MQHVQLYFNRTHVNRPTNPRGRKYCLIMIDNVGLWWSSGMSGKPLVIVHILWHVDVCRKRIVASEIGFLDKPSLGVGLACPRIRTMEVVSSWKPERCCVINARCNEGGFLDNDLLPNAFPCQRIFNKHFLGYRYTVQAAVQMKTEIFVSETSFSFRDS
jgi:hypothetical protein